MYVRLALVLKYIGLTLEHNCGIRPLPVNGWVIRQYGIRHCLRKNNGSVTIRDTDNGPFTSISFLGDVLLIRESAAVAA